MLQMITEDVGFAGSELPEPTLKAEAKEWLETNADLLQLWVDVEGLSLARTNEAEQYLKAVETHKML